MQRQRNGQAEPEPVALFAAAQERVLEIAEFVIGNIHWVVERLDNVAPFRVRSINARAAFRISSATRASGETNFGVNHGNKPIKSCVTKIWPSRCSPEPIPMVGMPIAFVICFAVS